MSSLSSSTIGNARCLLNGISDVSNSKHYAPVIPAHSVLDLLDISPGKNYIYNIALEENNGNATQCKSNLTDVINRAQNFIKNRDEVWGQDQLEGAIQDIVSSEGKFVCLLGGKNTGKSLLIENMTRRCGKILLVNLREEGNDILKGLYAVLGERGGITCRNI